MTTKYTHCREICILSVLSKKQKWKFIKGSLFFQFLTPFRGLLDNLSVYKAHTNFIFVDKACIFAIYSQSWCCIFRKYHVYGIQKLGEWRDCTKPFPVLHRMHIYFFHFKTYYQYCVNLEEISPYSIDIHSS